MVRLCFLFGVCNFVIQASLSGFEVMKRSFPVCCAPVAPVGSNRTGNAKTCLSPGAKSTYEAIGRQIFCRCSVWNNVLEIFVQRYIS